MKFSFEFLYSFGPTHARKIKTEMILAAFNNIYITNEGALKTQVLENASTEMASTKQRISQGWKTHVRKT